MAPRKREQKAESKRKQRRVSPLPEPKQDDVVAAIVHMGRLAAAHAGCGVGFHTALTEADDYPLDSVSLATLARVAKLLLADRKRMCARNTDVLKDRLHEAITRIYSEALNNPEVEENIEELAEQRVREIGFALGSSQMKRFAVDAMHIKERTASQASAEAVLDGIKGHRRPTTAGRSIFDAK